MPMSSASCGDSTSKCQHCQQLEERVDQQAEVIDELRDELAQLKADQKEDRDHAAKDRAEIRQQVSDVEDRVEDVEQPDNTQGSTGEDTPADTQERPQTPLEQTAGLPQDMIDRETANVRRAVFVAQDVDDYTRSVPAGRAITAGELGRVLRAGTDCNGHSQTVDRVIGILDEMGQDGVTVVDRRGERRVVFDESTTRRLVALGQDRAESSHAVVTGGEV